MKKLLSLFISIISTYTILAQAPSMICYQGVAADASGAEIITTPIGVRFSIIKGSPSGAVVYTETHETETDKFGLFALDMGSKPSAGNDLSKINWAKDGPFFLKIEMAVPRGSIFKDIGTSQMLSVPYALYSGKTAHADSATVAGKASNDKDIDPNNELQTFEFDKNTGKLKIVPKVGSVMGSDEIVIQDGDSDPKNEIQSLKFDAETGILGIYDPSGIKNGEVNTREGIFTAPGASPAFPQGILGTYRFVKTGETYTVPITKTFYVTSNGSPSTTMDIEYLGIKYKIMSFSSSPVLPGGTKITNTPFTGFEIDMNIKVQPVIIDLKNPYQIPPNKTLFIKSGIGLGNNTLEVDGEITSFLAVNNGAQVVTIPGGANGLTIKNPIGVPTVLTGYLLDAK